MKTPQEIKAQIKAVESSDWMGTIRGDLIGYLPFEDAKEFLKPEATKEDWDARKVLPPLDAAKDYLSFAWGKANGCRGISAGRSLDHLKAWLWLAGYGDFVDEHFDDYSYYGKAQLVMASTICDFDWKSQDNGEWVTDEESPSLSESVIAAMAADAEATARAAMLGVEKQAA